MLPILFRKKGVEELQFIVRKREIRYISSSLVGDNANYTATFAFDSEWNNTVKTARFINGNKYVDVLLENDTCIIPLEILKAGKIRVGVFSSEMTTTYCLMTVKESIKEQNGSPIEPTPDVYSQIISMIENMEISGVTDEQVERVVAKYLLENPIDTITESDVQRIVSEYVVAHKEELKGDKGDKGDTGTPGSDGMDGAPGADGKSAYDIAVDNGFFGTEQEWLESLKGVDGANGADGKDGANGADGYTPVKGTDYWTESDKTDIVNSVIEALPTAESEVY